MTQTELLPALTFTPPVISLNFEEIEARIDSITEQYNGLVVKEDDVPAIKNEMAGLNKLAGSLANARKDAAAKVSEPIKVFENRIKGLESKILITRTFLDDQVKAHIQRERDEKRAHVQAMIDIQKDEHGCAGLDIPIQESWLNKTAKDKTTTAEILAIILAHKKAVEDHLALEQAKKDRVVAIENHSAALASGRGYQLPFSRFTALQDLAVPLSDVLAQIEKAYADEDARRAEAATPKQEVPAPEPKKHWIDAPEPRPEPAPAIKAMTITATYDATNGAKIGVLYQQIKALCKTCTASVKELEHAYTARQTGTLYGTVPQKMVTPVAEHTFSNGPNINPVASHL